MDYIDLQPGTYHLSVQCQDDAVKYRTAVTLVAAELHEVRRAGAPGRGARD